MPERANVLRLVIEPGPVRERIANWDAGRPGAARPGPARGRRRRARPGDRRAGGSAAGRPDVAALLADAGPPARPSPVVDLRFDVDGAELSFFSVVSTIGTPIDVTAQELRLEAFFPADESTRTRWPALVEAYGASPNRVTG